MAEGCAWQGTMCAGETATEVDSMHPTGMHSYLGFIFQNVFLCLVK